MVFGILSSPQQITLYISHGCCIQPAKRSDRPFPCKEKMSHIIHFCCLLFILPLLSLKFFSQSISFVIGLKIFSDLTTCLKILIELISCLDLRCWGTRGRSEQHAQAARSELEESFHQQNHGCPTNHSEVRVSRELLRL